jgi:hypothetical protein
VDADISAGQQCKIGIGDGRAGDDGASRAVDAVVEERELAAVARLPGRKASASIFPLARALCVPKTLSALIS